MSDENELRTRFANIDFRIARVVSRFRRHDEKFFQRFQRLRNNDVQVTVALKEIQKHLGELEEAVEAFADLIE